MPKVKVPRKEISLDMTAMCDMAFLLLTFFMLTTKFKAEEPLVVDMPSSVSEIILPDSDVLTIAVGNQGKVFYNLDGQTTRAEVLDAIGKKYNIGFTGQEIKRFALMSSFGVPVSGLKSLINLNADERNRVAQPGIPLDSLNNQLRDWILITKTINPKTRIAIRGDKEAHYEVIEQVIATLQDLNINKIKLITTMENKPGTDPQKDK